MRLGVRRLFLQWGQDIPLNSQGSNSVNYISELNHFQPAHENHSISLIHLSEPEFIENTVNKRRKDADYKEFPWRIPH